MQENGLKSNEASVKELGIKDAIVHWNLSADELAKISVEKGMAQETSTGAINVNSLVVRQKTGLSLKMKSPKILFGGEILTSPLSQLNSMRFMIE